MAERVEAIRRLLESPCECRIDPKTVSLCERCNAMPDDLAEVLTALAQAERELAFYRKVGSRSAHSGCWQEYDAARAEVERLKEYIGEPGGPPYNELVTENDRLRADLARVRAALETSVAIMESILSEDRLYMEWVRASIVEARAALEGQ